MLKIKQASHTNTVLLTVIRNILPDLSFRLICWLLFSVAGATNMFAQPDGLGNKKMNYFPVHSDTIYLDSLQIMPESVSVSGVDTSAYTMLPFSSILIWRNKPLTDSVLISYRTLPQEFNKPYFRKDARHIEQSFAIKPFYYNATDAAGSGAFIDFGNVDYNGSFGRALSFGNSQDVVLNSQFNLQLEGDLGDSIKLSGAITDNTIPFQPEGNTQQLQEFDQVWIQLQRKRATLIVGDYDIKKPAGYFMQFYKRVQGGFFSTSFKTSAHGENKLAMGASLAKGKFVRNTLIPLEGNQGPYKLTGPNGEQFFIVLAGTERVYIDGIQLNRGEDYDYIIDYNTAEITFMPRRLITKDLRLVVEFEFSDRNYLNSLLYLSNEWTLSNKMQLRLNVYSNQDAKNQPVLQTLDSSRIRFLAGIGDSIQQAFYSSVQVVDTFSNSRVLYKKVDTSVDGTFYTNVYVFSTNRDSARYALNFSFLGQGKGNYRQSVNSANGRVYEWVPQSNGIPQGDYEPIILLVTPKKQQLITLAGSYAIDSNKHLNIETAYSNADPNSFSKRDNSSHHGVASRMDYTEQRRLDKTNTLTLQSKLSYEYVNQRFRPLERFRNVEFTRDWNVPSSESPQDEHLASASFSFSKQQLGKIDYQFGTYLRGSSFSGRQHIASVSGAKNGYRLLVKGDVMSQTSQLFSSTYYRPYLEFEKQLKRLQQATIGTRYLVEHNNLRDASSDSLSKTAFSFDALTVYLKTRNDATNQFALEYTHRYDRAAKENAFATATIGNTVTMNVTINSIKQQEIKLTAAYRMMDIVDSSITLLKPDETSLGRIEYGFSAVKGLVSGNVLYEFGSGQEQKREFAYFEVPAGQGMYVWRDYNNDSLKQLNEFELAIFPDEKRYIKVFTPTNQYVKAKYSQYNQMISINPRAFLGSAQFHGLSKLISLFFLQSAVQLNNRFIGDNGIQQYNPFIRYRGNDSLLINSASSIINSIFFNRFNNTWGVDYVNTLNGGRTLLNYGIDARRNTDHLIRGRLNASKQIAVTAAVKTGIRNFSSAFLENRAYQIQYQSVEPALTFLFRQNQLRIQTGYKYDERHNDASFGGESAFAHHINLEVKYNIISSGALSSRFTYAGIVFDGIENSGVGYAMMDGLLNGRNLLWQATFNKRVSKNIEMNLEYEGRKSGTGNVIHTGRASVRAIF